MDEPRFVLDTNVIVSGLMSAISAPGQALDKVLGAGRPLLSRPVLAELVEILGRDRLDRYVPREKRDRFLATLIEKALFPDIQESFRVCRDPKDDRFLDLAIAGHAAYLVTGDADLLVLSPFRGIPIVTPRTFLDAFPFGEDNTTRTDGGAGEGPARPEGDIR